MRRRDESADGQSYHPSTRTIWFAAALTILLAATACSQPPVRLNGFSEEAATRQVKLEDRLIGAPSALRLQDHHKFLTQGVPADGSEVNARNAEYFADQLSEFGFDSIIYDRFELVQPHLYDKELELLGETPAERTPLAVEERQSDAALYRSLTPHLADGESTAEVVFANRGHPRDYETLDARRVDVTGRIVVVRADEFFDRDVLRAAAKRGAAGMLLYAANDDFAAVTSGAHQSRFDSPGGDTQHPDNSSDDDPGPGDPTAAGGINALPVLAISQATASTVLAALNGPSTPHEWRGDIGMPERLGPSATPVRMRVRFDRRPFPIVNVVGLLIGEDLPDEWVVAGGHRDADEVGAWGAASGAAIRLESARIIARQVRRGYRPKRTIAIASWDAATVDRVGSTRWAARSKHSRPQVVAYLSQTSYAAGDFSAAGSHAFQPLVNDIARRVDFPRENQRLYERWRDQRMATAGDPPTRLGAVVDHGGWTDVRLGVLTETSDQSVFLEQPGIPSVALTFGESPARGGQEDSHDAFKREGDPKFDTGQQLAELSALFLTRVANADVPPLDFTATAETVERALDQVETRAKELSLRIRLGGVRDDARSFGLNAAALNAAIDEVVARPPEQRTEIADLMSALTASLVAVERGFLAHPSGAERRRPGHHLYGTAQGSAREGVMLPNIHFALESGDRRQAQEAVDALEARLSDIVVGIGEVLELAVSPPDSL